MLTVSKTEANITKVSLLEPPQSSEESPKHFELELELKVVEVEVFVDVWEVAVELETMEVVFVDVCEVVDQLETVEVEVLADVWKVIVEL